VEYLLKDIGNRFLLALKYKDYRTLWIANVCAGSAAWALIVARGWLVYVMTDSSGWAGLVTFMAMIPRFFATPLIGFLADRFDRQTVLSWTYILNVLNNIVLATLVSMPNSPMYTSAGPWILMVLAMLNGTFRAAQMTTTQSLIPNLVPKEHLLNAVSLNQATQQGSRFLGPLAMLIIIWVSTMTPWSSSYIENALAFWLCTAFYSVGLIQVLKIKTRSTGVVNPSKSFLANFLEGFKYVYSTPMLSAIILLAIAHCALVMSYESMLPNLSEEKLGAQTVYDTALLMSGVGIGALVTAVLLAGLKGSKERGQIFLVLALASGVTPIVLGFSSAGSISMIAAIFMGASGAGFMTITHTIMQMYTPDEVRGRVSGVYQMHIGVAMASANWINGELSDYFTAPNVMIVGGVIFIIVVLASLTTRFLRQLYYPATA
jgi:MFS family permease|tara:strand:- start:936 stop:2231 length:1296 start_codon:yes stop_codon:yes gene_type:complete